MLSVVGSPDGAGPDGRETGDVGASWQATIASVKAANATAARIGVSEYGSGQLLQNLDTPDHVTVT